MSTYSNLGRCQNSLVPESCRFCTGSGNVTVELGGGEKEVSRCINCDGAGSLTCTTCQGSGIQPRYLDRRYIVQLLSFFCLNDPNEYTLTVGVGLAYVHLN